LRGDLDNIVAKALRKLPAERYASVEALADDLRRHLRDEPVRARADSFAYRAAKFVRRHRGGVVATVIVVLAALAGTLGIAWQAREAQRQRDAAQAQLARATATNEFIGFLLSVAAPAGKRFDVTELLEQGEMLIDRQFAGNDPMRVEMLVAVGRQYMASERWDKATPALERAAEIASPSGDPALRARALCPLAALKMLNGERRQAADLMDRAFAELPDDPRYRLQRAECLTDLSAFGYFTEEAEPMIRNASAALEALARTPISTTTQRIDAQASLAYGYYLARQNEKADQAYAEVVRALERAGRERTGATADALNNWGFVHFVGDIARAEPLFRRSVELRRSIESADSITPTVSYNHAGVLLKLARYPEAERLLEETIRTAGARKEQRIELDAMMQLADLYIETGALARASAQLAKLTPLLDGPRFESMRVRAQWAYYHGRLALARGDPALAQSRFAEAIELFEGRKAKIAMNVLALIGRRAPSRRWRRGSRGHGCRARDHPGRVLRREGCALLPGRLVEGRPGGGSARERRGRRRACIVPGGARAPRADPWRRPSGHERRPEPCAREQLPPEAVAPPPPTASVRYRTQRPSGFLAGEQNRDLAGALMSFRTSDRARRCRSSQRQQETTCSRGCHRRTDAVPIHE
jgi:eukaryotic-like serine/threonine-protein kinase